MALLSILILWHHTKNIKCFSFTGIVKNKSVVHICQEIHNKCHICAALLRLAFVVIQQVLRKVKLLNFYLYKNNYYIC